MPVPYAALNPVSLELKQEKGKQVAGAGHAWLYVEPDGNVLPGARHQQEAGQFAEGRLG